MGLTVLNVAYPLAPVSRDAVGGAEQVLVALDKALVEAGHNSIVLACEGSSGAGTLFAVPAETGRLDDAARRRAHSRHREAIAAARRQWSVDLVHLHGIDFDAIQARAPGFGGPARRSPRRAESVLPFDRRDFLAEILTDDDVETLRHAERTLGKGDRLTG